MQKNYIISSVYSRIFITRQHLDRMLLVLSWLVFIH